MVVVPALKPYLSLSGTSQFWKLFLGDEKKMPLSTRQAGKMPSIGMPGKELVLAPTPVLVSGRNDGRPPPLTFVAAIILLELAA